MTVAQFQTTIGEQTGPLQTENAELPPAIEKTEKATRQMSDFLANMSHEFRTPISSIIVFAELLQSAAFGPLTAKQTDCVDNILAGGRHLLTLINDLLDLSKSEVGKLTVQPGLFLLQDAIETAIRSVRPQADRKCQRIECSLENGLSWIKADPTRFKQILFNLLSNAIKFTHERGEIRITSQVVPPAALGSESTPGKTATGKVVEIAVADTGIGINAPDLIRLFQRFTQLEAPSATQYRGSGLGLALTKCLVELHGGSIRAHSDGEGRGSTFTIRLPQD